MRVYVINLKRSTERRKNIEAQLKRLGVQYEIIEAVDGRNMSEEEFNHIVSLPEEFTKSQAGCQLSHNKVYTRMQENRDDIALVLEDDVLITDNKFKELLNRLENQVNKQKITLLTYYWCRDNNLKLSKKNPEQKITAADSYQVCTPHEIHGIGRAAAYILSKETAKSILDFHTPKLICQADSWVVYYDHNLITGVDCVYPMPVTENPKFGSEIGYTRNKIEAIGKRMVEKAVNMNMPIITGIIMKKRMNFAKTYKNIILEQ